MELNYKNIGKRIKTTRLKAHLSQERLAEFARLSPSHLSNIETGSTKMSLTALVNLANALAVTPDDLLCDNVIHTQTQFERDLQELLKSCNAYELRIVTRMLAAMLSSLRDCAVLKDLEAYYEMFRF